MIIFSDREQININEQTAVAIGKFDGIHLGHARLLEKLKMAGQTGLKTLIFSFNPSPAAFFGFTDNLSLTTNTEKRYFLEKMGIDYLVEFPFDSETSKIPAQAFIGDMLCKKLNCAYIAAGDDLSFGYRGQGNADMLKEYAPKFGYSFEKIEKIKIDDLVVSSTLIRSLLTANKISDVKRYLGHGYYIFGRIEGGNKIGNTIGFPTINIIPEPEKMLPQKGVYYSNIYLDNAVYRGITNIGVKPSVSDEKKLVVETYIFDFNQIVYGKEAVIELLEFKRPEMYFDGLSQLKAAIENDKKEAEYFFKKISEC